MERDELGVQISISVGGENLEILDRDTGYLGELLPGSTAIISTYVEKQQNILGISVDGSKHIVLKKDWLKKPFGLDSSINSINDLTTNDLRLYKAKVSIKAGQQAYTTYPENNLRLVKIYPDGRIEIWEIALVSQKGDFFLTVQKTYEAECYNNDNIIVCPMFSAKWWQMVQFLNEAFVICFGEDIVENLKPHTEWQPEAEIVPELPANTGLVIWYNLAQGLGAVKINNGSVARVHWSQIEPRDGLAYLEKDEVIRYEGIRRPMPSSNWQRQTSFTEELTGVSAVS